MQPISTCMRREPLPNVAVQCLLQQLSEPLKTLFEAADEALVLPNAVKESCSKRWLAFQVHQRVGIGKGHGVPVHRLHWVHGGCYEK